VAGVSEILEWYESDNPGTKANLARILNHGHLAGTGKVVILPVDQGFEHGPDKSFVPNPAAYDPHYHFQLAIDAGLNAFAAPLGMLERGASHYAGQIPLILKLTNANGLFPKESPKTQALTASVKDALRLGCSAVGLTIYPGSATSFEMIEMARGVIAEAKEYGLPTVVWSYPRDGDLSQKGETALDVCAYATQIAALIGAHIIKVKLPTDYLEQGGIEELYQSHSIKYASLTDRVRHIMKSAFDGHRLVVFSGGGKKGEDSLFEEARAIRDGGGAGSIIGRNSFQRKKPEAMMMLEKVISIYKGASA
jgi:class I fructose-bisphosphate aldolase